MIILIRQVFGNIQIPNTM